MWEVQKLNPTWLALRFTELQQNGLTLTNDMTQAQRRAAVKETVQTT